MELEVLRHSAAHIMAQAVKRLYPGVKISIGPAIENGFYYDFEFEEKLSEEELPRIEEEMKKITREKLEIKREELSRKEAAELFRGEPYKEELLKAIPEGEEISVYRQGEFVDLCRGPHVGNTGEVKHYKLLSIAGAYWRGDSRNKMLTRIYGTAFLSKEKLKEYVKRVEEAARRDHRKLGQELGLFSLHEEAPGMPFFHAKGMIMWNELLGYWREVHKKYGYEEISTPIIMRRELWERSGHWSHYKENMYALSIEEEEYAVKPMNCPGGMIVYGSEVRSYRDLPLRLAELGKVHRHEMRGALHGLFRVRAFTQDDAHIFMTSEQIEPEIQRTIDLFDEVYRRFGLEYEAELSTRPENSMGSDEQWERAESGLRKALENRGMEYKVNEGDGAFYGPKIDFHIKDSMGRRWQCGTIQLDMQLPERFELKYIDRNGEKVEPVMVHRVVYGSIERFIGILTEHFGGAFPLWLAPVQVRILPVSEKQGKYAEELAEEMREAGLRVEVDGSNETLSKRMRKAQVQKTPYTLTIGEREEEGGEIPIRKYGGEQEKLERSYLVRWIREKAKRRELGY